MRQVELEVESVFTIWMKPLRESISKLSAFKNNWNRESVVNNCSLCCLREAHEMPSTAHSGILRQRKLVRAYLS